MKSYKRTGKKKRFTLKDFYPDLPEGWGLYSPNEVEEKGKTIPFIYASKYYREKFLSGDESAIYDFVKNYDNCFREKWVLPDGSAVDCYTNNNIERGGNGRSWVIEQIEKWKKEGTPEAKKKLKKLFVSYTDSRGKGKYNDPKKALGIYERIEKERETKSVREAVTHITNMGGEVFQHTERDKYYEVKKCIEKGREEKDITEKNLRFEYFFPTKGINIPIKYREHFLKELILYREVELLTRGVIRFHCYRQEAKDTIRYHRNREKTIPLEKAIKQVAKRNKISPAAIKDIYTIYKGYEAHN
ncbi:MAG: hypothetical protein HY578_00715 [Nitrospinae bacterium]|nr:hypothetical protein [Nitrospinota bacterium]